MAALEHYGDLSNEELLAFLHEIEQEDEDIIEAEAEATEALLINDEPENEAENTQEAENVKTVSFKQRKIEIQRMAFNQKKLSLNDKIPKEQLQLLIELLTEPHTKMLQRNKKFINKRIGSLLRPLIPGNLRHCFRAYPHAVKASMGFMYEASEEYGNGFLFWVTPNIPYYFEQGTEMAVLRKNKSYLYSIDKAIVRFNYHKKELTRKEINYAVKLLNVENKSYYDLLKLNPFWFEILYKKLTDNA